MGVFVERESGTAGEVCAGGVRVLSITFDFYQRNYLSYIHSIVEVYHSAIFMTTLRALV